MDQQVDQVAPAEELVQFSLDDLDQSKACETPYEFEVVDENNGKGIGIFISVIGGQAKVIDDFTSKMINQRRVAEAMAQKTDPRGKRPHVVPIEEDFDFSMEVIALRVVGWRGRIKEPYSPKNALRLCKQNQPIREQILAASNDLKNFPIGALRS